MIDPTDDASFNAYGNADDLGTVRIDGTNNGQPTGAKLVAHDTQFGYIAPGGRANVGDVEIKATLQLEGAAKAYLTDSAVSTISDSKVGELPAVYLDTAANLYEQETTESNGPASYSTNFDTPSFANIKSEYVGDYLTSGQYKASAHFDSQNAVSESVTDASKSRGLWKLDDQASVDDLEKLVAAKADKLTDGATESASDPSDAAQGATVTANLPLGKSQVYGKYEIAKNDGTSIKGDGHAYAYSPVHDLQAGWDVSAYRAKGTFTAPEAGATSGIGGDVAPEGYVFAGWYTQGGDLRTGEPNNSDKFTSGIEGIKALSKPGLDSYAAQHVLAKDAKSGYAYAKFIPASLVDAKAQYKTEGASPAVRFLGAVESYNYNGIAFDVTQYDADGKQLDSKSLTTTTAYDYVLANVNGREDQKQYGNDIFKATAYGSKDQLPLLITRAYWKGLDSSFKGKFTVAASLTTPDGTVVKGPVKTFVVNNGKVTADNQ